MHNAQRDRGDLRGQDRDALHAHGVVPEVQLQGREIGQAAERLGDASGADIPGRASEEVQRQDLQGLSRSRKRRTTPKQLYPRTQPNTLRKG